MSTNSLKSPVLNGNQQQLQLFLQNHQQYLEQQQPVYALSHMEYAYFHNDRFEVNVVFIAISNHSYICLFICFFFSTRIQFKFSFQYKYILLVKKYL